MSTGCQIGIYEKKESKLNDWDVLIYRHSDGYPERVIPDIQPFLEWWDKVRGISDTNYCGVRLLQYLCNKYDKERTEIIEKIMFNPLAVKEKNYLTGIYGYGVCKSFDYGAEYFYKVYPGNIEVYDKDLLLMEIIKLNKRRI